MSRRPQSQRDPNGDAEVDPRKAFVEQLALTLTEIGLQRTAARVFAALTVADSGALTAAELAHTLSISPAAVSGAVRYLEQVGMVAKERRPGERRDHYRLYDDLWFASFLKRDRLLRMWHETTVAGIDAVGADTPAGRRLADMADFLAFLTEEIPVLFDRWHEQRARRAQT
ncbi:GbsR/MarR family transcriptional regulator [Saccharomonospora piscinae]|uniref:Transcriptional regulator n=1 Tax=Saccharomonospora piscinae TaxID=687388 RepID=A0A1V9A757_SACPI|nr:MarR family transcriptional regulator [Saccharomonospora piscinae]OQO92965.1 transcriptional regulator [Saccharomonospora piscinae]TLW93101.1 MarR family transcriptional regulator [Saccharomonospora piscinae]